MKSTTANSELPDSTEERDKIARNALVLIAATFLTKTADSLANPKITLTWLLQSMGASAAAISLLVPIRESGALLPQAALASLANSRSRQAGLYRLGTLVQGAAALGMLASVATLEGTLAGWAVVLCLAILSLARCLCSLTHKAMIGKGVPKGLRGQTNGWASSAAGLATCIVAVLLILVQGAPGVQPLMWMVAVAGLAWWLATLVISFLDEPEQKPKDADNRFWQRLKLLRKDAHFLRFVIARALLTSSALVAPYYVMLQAGSENPLAGFGALLLASGVASLIASPLWGRLADHSSRLVLLLSATLVSALGLSTVVLHQTLPELFSNAWLVPALYFCLELAHQGIRVGRKTYIVDMANDDNRVDYVAVSNSTIGLILLFVGLISSGLSTILPPVTLIALLSLLSAAGAILGRSLPEVE
ncbi:MFS transporter [Granulosicoccus sp. 3-233]|uniref:MFS transporter n=1 Tax=Granulosicoccus sp. 3-233 TaxID=3417969 RepID=UPI003D346382